MLLRVFKGYQASILLLIPLIGLLLWLNVFFDTTIYTRQDYLYMPLSKMIFNLVGYNSFFSKLIAIILVLLNSLLLVRMNIAYNFIRARTYLPAIMYIVLLSHIKQIQILNPALMASVFIILAINKVLQTFKKERLAIQIMDAALLLSIASLFYFPSLFLITYLWIGLIILRPFRWREWAFSILGTIIPYFVYACIAYMKGMKMTIPIMKIINIPYIIKWHAGENIFSLLFFGYASLLIILASLQMLKLFGTKKVHSRKFFIFFLWLFILTAALYFLISSTTIEIFYINAISLSFLFAHYFVNLKSGWISELMFILFIGIVVLNKFF